MIEGWWVWGLFGALVFSMLTLDLGALRRSLLIILGAVTVSAAFSLMMIPPRPAQQKLERA